MEHSVLLLLFALLALCCAQNQCNFYYFDRNEQKINQTFTLTISNNHRYRSNVDTNVLYIMRKFLFSFIAFSFFFFVVFIFILLLLLQSSTEDMPDKVIVAECNHWYYNDVKQDNKMMYVISTGYYNMFGQRYLYLPDGIYLFSQTFLMLYDQCLVLCL